MKIYFLPFVLFCAACKHVVPALKTDRVEANRADSGDPMDGQDTAESGDTGEDTGAADYPVSNPDPSIQGPYASEHITSSDFDGDVYLPAGSGPFPVVVLSPGFQLSPSDYTSYGEHFASWGYVTLLVDFPGGLLGGPTHTENAQTLGEVLDWVEGGPIVLGGRADASSIALMGHSMGGKLSLLLASTDERPDLVIGIDPVDAVPPFGGSESDYPSVTPERMGSISIPLLLFGEQNNADGAMACAPAAENFQQYYNAASSPVLEVDFTTAFHMSFLDNPSCLLCLACPTGTDDTDATKATVRAISTAFLESKFRPAPWTDAWLDGPELDALESTGVIVTRSKNDF